MDDLIGLAERAAAAVRTVEEPWLAAIEQPPLPGVDEGVRAWLLLADAAKRLTNLAREMERSYGRAIDQRGEPIDVPGLGVITATWKPGYRSVDREAVVQAVTLAAVARREPDMITGEIESPADAVAREWRRCFRFEPRWTPIRAMGLDPDEFGERTSHGSYKIEVTRDEGESL